MPGLYTSTSVLTAVREANPVGDLQPTMLVSYLAHIECVFDTRGDAILATTGMSKSDLTDPTWRDEMKGNGEARTQRFARELLQQDYNGLHVRSLAKGADPADMNLMLRRWSGSVSSIEVVDDNNRLGFARCSSSP